MRITIKTKQIKLVPEIKNFIESRIGSLEKFIKNILERDYKITLRKEKPKIEAQIEIGKETLHHRKGPFYYAECQMKLPGKFLRAESLKENLKSAIIEIKEELERQIKDYKKKLVAKTERGARKAKRELKISELAKKKEGKRILREGI